MILVAVGNSGTPEDKRAAVSTDVSTWVAETTPVFPNTSGKSWSDVCYSPALDMFCAISSNGGTVQVMTKTGDGAWIAQTTPEANTWNSICWAQPLGLFVAVASDGTHRVMTSPNGSTWTLRTSAEQNSWRGICWSLDLALLVAVSDDGTHRVMTSPDGSTWTPQTHSTNSCKSVAWDQVLGILIAVGNTGGHVAISSDAVTWVDHDCSATLSSFGYNRIVSDNGGTFLMVGGNGGQVAVSTDGTTWTRTDGLITSGDGLLGACRSFLSGLWVVTGIGGIATSPDGKTPWTVRTIPTGVGWKAVAEASYGSWDAGVAVEAALGLNSNGGNPNTYPSKDITITWSRRNRISGSPAFVTDDVPLSEASEKYDVDIVAAGQVVRSFLGLTSPQAVYTKAQQQADGWTTLPVQLTLRVYQISDVVGRGLTQEVTVDVTG